MTSFRPTLVSLLLCGVLVVCAAWGQSTTRALSPAQLKLYDAVLDSIINPCPAENATVLNSNPTCEYANMVRADALKLVLAGKSKKEIVNTIIAEYTNDPNKNPDHKDLRAMPRTWVAWATPFAMLILATVVGMMVLRAWKKRSSVAHEGDVHPPLETLHVRIEKELSDLRNS